MERIWLQSYEPGVPADINPDLYSSLNEFFIEFLDKFKDLPAITNMGKSISYSELEQKAKCFASYLQNTLQIEKGERFAIMLPNIIQYPVAILGILLSGCIVVNVNPLYTADELQHQIQDSQAVGIIVLENVAHTVAEILSQTSLKHVIVTRISDEFDFPKSLVINSIVKYVKRLVPKWDIKSYYWYNDILAIGAKTGLKTVKVTNKDIAFLQYTGGTTGLAKGAILTHRNILANVQQVDAWCRDAILYGREISVLALPLYHIFGLMTALVFMGRGANNLLITNPRDTAGFIKEIKKYRFTLMTGVNTLFNSMLNNPIFATLDFSSLKFTLGGGMATQKVVAERWYKLTKNKLLEAYGLTEASPGVCINPLNITEFTGAIGLPLPSTEISIRDDKNIELGIGETGELLVRGPQVMRGYWNQETETDNVLNAEGWLRTGDIAVIDHKGFVRLVDRKKDMIIVSGFNVYPNEVEGILAAMPEILEVAVIGVPDPVHGEMVKAFIVKRDQKLTEQDVLNYCHKHLTLYKIPHAIEFRESLPKTNVGKVLRRALR